MGERFGHAEEEQRDADPGGEQHAGPGEIAELRLVMVRAQLHLAVAGQRHADHEHQVHGHRQQVVPADVARRPGLRFQQQHAGGNGKRGDQNGECRHDRGGKQEDGSKRAHLAGRRLHDVHG
ncbi:hypothetical protein D9M71_772390 [compost metagenome]